MLFIVNKNYIFNFIRSNLPQMNNIYNNFHIFRTILNFYNKNKSFHLKVKAFIFIIEAKE